MGSFFVKLFAPWKAEAEFEDEDAFRQFLLRRNRALNALRVVLFAAAAVCLLASYAFEIRTLDYAAVGALVVALGATLVIAENEKQLPEELRQK